MATAFFPPVIILGREIGRLCQGEAEKDRRMGLWTTVRLQHSRDEFPFVVYSFFSSSSLIRFLLIIILFMSTTIQRWSGWVSFACSTIFPSSLNEKRWHTGTKGHTLHYWLDFLSSFWSSRTSRSQVRFHCVFVTDSIGIIDGVGTVVSIRLDGQSPTGWFYRKGYRRTER